MSIISIILGMIKVGETVALWYLVVIEFNLTKIAEINTASFVMIFFSGISTIFAMRVRSFFWEVRPSLWLLLVSLADVIFVVVASAVGIDALSLSRISMGVIGVIVAWSLVFQLVVNNFIMILLFKLILPQEHRFLSHYQ
jgi:H+-transporting ATPase